MSLLFEYLKHTFSITAVFWQGIIWDQQICWHSGQRSVPNLLFLNKLSILGHTTPVINSEPPKQWASLQERWLKKESDENLRNEGVSENRIKRVGNVMIDSLFNNLERSKNSTIHSNLNIEKGNYHVIFGCIC